MKNFSIFNFLVIILIIKGSPVENNANLVELNENNNTTDQINISDTDSTKGNSNLKILIFFN
jgi:hypothetical protein